jgi:phenylacetate-coenzyme A ligase PaaK-like adenylate-forming protein
MEQTGEDPSLLLALRQQLRARDFWTRQQLEEHQLCALEALRTYAYTHSPFYQRFHQGLTDRPLHELPVLTKAVVMESFDDLVTDRTIRRRDVETMGLRSRFLQRYLTLSTSGSTGRRGVFLFNDGDWHVLLASYLRAMEDWTNLAHDGEYPIRTAAVSSSTPWHPSASVNASLHSRFFPMLGIDATTLIDTMVEQLNSWQPELFIGYPSSLYALAQEQLAGRLQIAPRAIIASSEVVVEHQRRRMQAAWGNEIFTMYGTTEGGCVAMECDQHAGLHLFEDLLIVEVVDQDKRQ